MSFNQTQIPAPSVFPHTYQSVYVTTPLNPPSLHQEWHENPTAPNLSQQNTPTHLFASSQPSTNKRHDRQQVIHVETTTPDVGVQVLPTSPTSPIMSFASQPMHHQNHHHHHHNHHNRAQSQQISSLAQVAPSFHTQPIRLPFNSNPPKIPQPSPPPPQQQQQQIQQQQQQIQQGFSTSPTSPSPSIPPRRRHNQRSGVSGVTSPTYQGVHSNGSASPPNQPLPPNIQTTISVHIATRPYSRQPANSPNSQQQQQQHRATIPRHPAHTPASSQSSLYPSIPRELNLSNTPASTHAIVLPPQFHIHHRSHNHQHQQNHAQRSFGSNHHHQTRPNPRQQPQSNADQQGESHEGLLSEEELSKLVLEHTILPTDHALIKGHCGICHDRYEVGDQILTLPCFDKFHFNCISEWFEREGEDWIPQSCPFCRVSVAKAAQDALDFGTKNGGWYDANGHRIDDFDPPPSPPTEFNEELNAFYEQLIEEAVDLLHFVKSLGDKSIFYDDISTFKALYIFAFEPDRRDKEMKFNDNGQISYISDVSRQQRCETVNDLIRIGRQKIRLHLERLYDGDGDDLDGAVVIHDAEKADQITQQTTSTPVLFDLSDAPHQDYSQLQYQQPVQPTRSEQPAQMTQSENPFDADSYLVPGSSQCQKPPTARNEQVWVNIWSDLNS